jgi:hypothetical protein
MFLGKILFIFFLSCLAWNVSAQTIATAQDNPPNYEWDDTDSWDSSIPGCFDIIVIPAGVYLEIGSTVDLGPNPGDNCGPVEIIIAGDLYFQSGKKLKLPTGSTFSVLQDGSVTAGGGGGSSSYIEIGSETVWDAGQGDITVPITLCEGCSQLVVELISFELKQNDRAVDLFWATASEENNDHFTIERSDSQNSWTQIALIDGNGTTSETNYYNYQDYPSKDGLYYYRLFQTDHDGTRELLGELSMNFSSELTVIRRYDLLGKDIVGSAEGLVIELLSNGSTRKVYYGK